MNAGKPVWLKAPFNALPATNIKLLLHPTDLTQGSEKAFAVAVSLARQHDAALIIAHALPPPTPLFESESPHRAQAEAALARLAAVAAESGVSARRILIDSTAAVSDSIVRCAEDVHADMIGHHWQNRHHPMAGWKSRGESYRSRSMSSGGRARGLHALLTSEKEMA